MQGNSYSHGVHAAPNDRRASYGAPTTQPSVVDSA